MRRPIVFAVAGIAALGSAGGALAHSLAGNGLKTGAVAATFSAAPAASASTRTCTGGDGTYVITRGDWTGSATSASGRLTGVVAIRGELGLNQTTGLGWFVGRVKIDGGSDGRVDAGANLRAVISGGKLSGFVDGRIRDAGTVYGSVSATVANGGLADGAIGGGSVNPAALVIDQGSCTSAPAQKPVVSAKGTITALSATSVTVQPAGGAAQTCSVGADLAASVAKLKTGDTAAITCGLVDGSYRLLRIEATALQTKPVLKLEGRVTTVSATSLSVADHDAGTVSCVVGSDLASAVARVSVGQKVKATCGYIDGAYRLLSIRIDR